MKTRQLNAFVFVATIALLVLLASSNAPLLDASTTLPARDGLLQFTTAGHVLGFQRDGVYVASVDAD